MRIEEMINRKIKLSVAATGVAVTLIGCDLTVTNPGPIQDEALDDPSVFPALVTGMSADFSYALTFIARYSSIFADDLAHSGSYNNEGYMYRGVAQPDHVNGRWAAGHQARWVAENGIERMQAVWDTQRFESSPLAPRAYLFAGFSNRLLGETWCHAVIDGSEAMPNTVHFERARDQFSEALRLARAQGHQEFEHAALAGRASMRAWLGDWNGAVEDASQVPTEFLLEAVYSLNSARERNDLWYETHQRLEYTVYNTQWANVDDPRVPFDTLYAGEEGAFRMGQDGLTPAFQQLKYPEAGSNVPIVKGTEMLILRAEAALRGGNVATFEALTNEQRAFYGLEPISAANEDEAWDILQDERGAVLWIEGRRIWDLRRWLDEGRNDYLAGDRDQCFPIAEWEVDSNPNL